MSRPQPTHVCSHTEGDLVIEICAADAVYAVLYCGRPIKIRKHNPSLRYQGMKYSKTAFPEPGHAIRLARKLNTVYNTTDFSVAVMTEGRTLKEVNIV